MNDKEKKAYQKANQLYAKARDLVNNAKKQARKLRAQARKLTREFGNPRPRMGTRAYFKTEEEFKTYKVDRALDRFEYWNQYLSCSECSAERGKPCRDSKGKVKQRNHFERDYNHT